MTPQSDQREGSEVCCGHQGADCCRDRGVEVIRFLELKIETPLELRVSGDSEVFFLGACPAGCRQTLPLWYPQGAWRFWSPPYLPLALFLAPYPPDPLPQWGRGRFLFRRGLRPGTPALNRLRHLQNLPSRYPAGCLPSLPPAYPAFSLLYCPIPRPPSRREGETQKFISPGLRPGTPALDRLRHL